MPISPETRALLAIRLVPGIGPRLTAALLERFVSAERVLHASTRDLQEIPYLGEELAEKLQKALHSGDVDAELALMEQHGVNVVGMGDTDYPAALAQIPSPPPLLYVGGKLLPQDAKAVAVVGSRHCTGYGRRVAQRLGNDLVRAGYTVVSGLARGIDGAAHAGALEAGGRTIAVLAGGLAKIYPPEHADLAKQIQTSGALVCESCMSMAPLPNMFPERNRIISGLSRAVVVVEAAEKSGALITAHHAAEQGREVFAVPGPVDSPASGGTLQLLRQGAKIARHAGDILEDLEGLLPGGKEAEKPEPPGLGVTEKRIWQMLGDQPHNIDDIARHVEKGVAELSGILMTLEMKKIIRRLPGNLYERL